MEPSDTTKKYLDIVRHYEATLDAHGDTPLGVDWPTRERAESSYKVMLEVIKERAPNKVSLLDFGCGASHLYEYMAKAVWGRVDYAGLDISPKFIELCRAKFPHVRYYCLDVLEEGSDIPCFDYIIMNGVLTERRNLSFEEMWSYAQRLIARVFSKANKGIAFNVMSKQVDWERDHLFHLPIDMLVSFVVRKLSRYFTIRHDYHDYHYTAYVYKSYEPAAVKDAVPARYKPTGECAAATGDSNKRDPAAKDGRKVR